MKKNMRKRILKYSLFSLLLVFTLLLAISPKIKAVSTSEKLISLQGATITWTDRLTNEKIVNFVENNTELFEVENTEYANIYIVNLDYILNYDNVNYSSFTLHKNLSNQKFELVNDEYDMWYDNRYSDVTIFSNLQPNDQTPAGLLENRAFIDFIQDVCDIEGGVWEEINNENITGSIFNVFTLITGWISSVVLVVVPIMWTGTELTTVGILAVCGLAVSVILLLIALISRFLKFRG